MKKIFNNEYDIGLSKKTVHPDYELDVINTAANEMFPTYQLSKEILNSIAVDIKDKSILEEDEISKALNNIASCLKKLGCLKKAAAAAIKVVESKNTNSGKKKAAKKESNKTKEEVKIANIGKEMAKEAMALVNKKLSADGFSTNELSADEKLNIVVRTLNRLLSHFIIQETPLNVAAKKLGPVSQNFNQTFKAPNTASQPAIFQAKPPLPTR